MRGRVGLGTGAAGATGGGVALLVQGGGTGATVGTVLTSSLRGPSGASITARQWTRDGVAISGATSATYTLTSADIGHTIGCTGTVQLSASGSTAIAAPSVPLGALTIDGQALYVDGQALVVT